MNKAALRGIFDKADNWERTAMARQPLPEGVGQNISIIEGYKYRADIESADSFEYALAVLKGLREEATAGGYHDVEIPEQYIAKDINSDAKVALPQAIFFYEKRRSPENAFKFLSYTHALALNNPEIVRDYNDRVQKTMQDISEHYPGDTSFEFFIKVINHNLDGDAPSTPLALPPPQPNT